MNIKSPFRLPGLVRQKFSWLIYLSIVVSWVGCSPKDFPSNYDDPSYFTRASVDVVNQSFREDPTGRGNFFDSPGKSLVELNAAIEKDDRDAVNKLLRKYGGSSYVNRSIQPANFATLVAANDTLPPVSSASKRSPNHFGLLYGVQLIGKGSGSTGGSTRMTYLEPFGYVTYSYDLPDNKGYLFGGLGPYLAYGLWGKIKSGTYSANTFDSQTGYSRFDAGLGLTLGYQLPQGLRLSIVREIGLVNIQRNSPYEKVYNRVWSFNVAYPLRKITDKLGKKKP